jgi:uncharacterized protein YrrD
MSLQTGGKLAQTMQAIIDPRNLTIAAFELEGPLLSHSPAYLRVNEIREVSSIGMIIDSNDEIVTRDDVISLENVLNMNFQLIGLTVIDEMKHKLGKVEDYTLETGDFVIQQLHIKRGLLRGLTDTGLLIHRSQVVEITDTQIVVKTTAKKVARPIEAATRHEYVNPFRQSPQPDGGA